MPTYRVGASSYVIMHFHGGRVSAASNGAANTASATFGPLVGNVLQEDAPRQKAQRVFFEEIAVGGDITLLPDVALATASGLVPALIFTLQPAVATATALANVPTLVVAIPPAVATATASAPVPTIKVTLLPAVATATASAPVPTILIGLFILPNVATATASGLVPTLAAQLLPSVATATASALLPTLRVTVLPAVATGTASAPVPTLRVTISPAVATATATAPVPSLAISITILAPVATATASGLVPTIVAGLVGKPVKDPQALGLELEGRAVLIVFASSVEADTYSDVYAVVPQVQGQAVLDGGSADAILTPVDG